MATPQDLPNIDDMDQPLTSRMLRLGLGGTNTPVVELARRLESLDGPAWFNAAMQTRPLSTLGNPSGPLEGLSLEQLQNAKNAGKTLVAKALSVDDRRRGTLAYFLGIAGAMAYHGKPITDQPWGSVAAALDELTVVLPEGWGLMMAKAAMSGDGK